jgi:hypothetical protein
MPISSALGSSALLPAGLGFRNLLINGDFGIWQRGTSAAMATGSGTGYLADRWTAARAGYAAGGTVSRQSASLDGFQYCSRIQRNSGNTSTAIVYYFQTMETANSVPVASKTVTYSFYIRAGANLSGTLLARLYSGTATDQVNYPDAAITGSATVITSALSVTTSWQRVVLTGQVGSTATQLFTGFEWTPSGTAGAADFFEVTGVQLEANAQPTPFEQLPIAIETSLCQRYFYIIPAGGITVYNPYWNVGLSGGGQWANYNHPVEMRVVPALRNSSGGVSFSFGYPRIDAGASWTGNLAEQNTTTKAIASLLYSSVNNGGVQLAGGAVNYSSALSSAAIHVIAEL